MVGSSGSIDGVLGAYIIRFPNSRILNLIWLGFFIRLVRIPEIFFLPGILSHETPPAPDRLLKGGDSIDIGDLHFSVLHTPGHTPGGICLSGHDVVFTGDTLFNYGIGRTDLPRGSYSHLMNSLHNKLMMLPDNTAVYPGHGPETTISAERRGNPFLRDQ